MKNIYSKTCRLCKRKSKSYPEIYNERNCIIIEAGKEKDEKYWIDNETGIILKYQPENGAPTEFKLELNNVTEAEVQKPSIDGYEVSYVEEVV